MRYYTREEGEIGGNTTIVLTGHAFLRRDGVLGDLLELDHRQHADRGRARRGRVMTSVAIACLCPPQGDEVRHPGGDTVTLREQARLRGGARGAQPVIHAKTNDPGMSVAEVQAMLTELYLLSGIEAWSVVDERGKPIEPTTARHPRDPAAELEAAMTVADAADERYAEAVMTPLLARASSSSPPTPDDSIDISDDWLIARAPEAVEAILDLHYPDGRHRDDFTVARWRLQVIAERGYGRLVGEHNAMEAARLAQLERVTHGRR